LTAHPAHPDLLPEPGGQEPARGEVRWLTDELRGVWDGTQWLPLCVCRRAGCGFGGRCSACLSVADGEDFRCGFCRTRAGAQHCHQGTAPVLPGG
jgi:hypothetical protein